jgi:hypothetical protein
MKRSLFIFGLITMFLFAGQTAAQNTVMTFDRQATDIDAAIESSKERGYHPYAQEFQNGERPRGYFGNIYDRHAVPDIDWTIESSTERGTFPQEFSDPETRAYFGEEYERRQPDIDRTIESSKERGLVDPRF